MSEGAHLIGQTVHYVSYGTPGGEYTSECRAAVITALSAFCEAHMQCMQLVVINPEGMYFNSHVPYNGGTQQREGTWHWPESA